MAFTPGNITSGSATAGTSLTVNKPTGVVAGNMLFAHIGWEKAAGTPTGGISTPPSGWTLVADENTTNQASAVYYKIAGSSEPSDYTWSGIDTSDGDQKFGIIADFPGQAVDTPLNASNSSSQNSTSTATVSTITPSIANCAIILTFCCRNIATFSGYALATSSPTFTELFDNNAGQVAIGLAYGIRPETTATGNGTATLSGAQAVTSYMLAIAQGVDVSIEPDVLNIGVAKGEPAFTPNVLELNLNFGGGENPAFTNKGKSSTTWTNQDKS